MPDILSLTSYYPTYWYIPWLMTADNLMVVQNNPAAGKDWVKIPVDLPSFIFGLRACKNAVITFMADPTDMESHAYDIKIGKSSILYWKL